MTPKKTGALSSGTKNAGILAGWIGGILIAGGLAWFLTQPLRVNFLMRAVNQVFLRAGEAHRLSAAIPPENHERPFGSWYALENSPDRAVVFSVMIDGVLASFAAIVSPEGTVDSVIPLSGHAVQIMDRLPGSTLRPYIRRVEAESAGRNR
ncbi:MAG: hypothetical protein LBP32_04840 [Spirochaetaceae bacterium]|jgi:hypothetical protein|nr:hypothetical protein [Spirochaetaceae bacterium]